MELPDSLQPWREWLAWFAPELVSAVADLLGRLQPLLGPLRGASLGGEPEPDGLGDLQRRGPYERLLTSEWLLAEELPDEFLRRAAGGEHLFLAPRHRASQANRLIVALFDAGPGQLGAPRLAHLALLILLARRARESGGELRWGILQEPGVLHTFETAADLRLLLRSRTYRVAQADWLAWQAHCVEPQDGPGECWLVGQRLLGADRDRTGFTHGVQVCRSLDSQSLELELLLPAGRRSTCLPLPPDAYGKRLLLGQFQNEVPVEISQTLEDRVSLTLPPVISSSGSHIALPLLEEAGVLVVKLPSLQKKKKAMEIRKNLWTSDSSPLAVTFLGKYVGAVLSKGSQLSFWQMTGFGPVLRPEQEQFNAPPGRAAFLQSAWLRNGQAERLYVIDTAGRLVFWVGSLRKPVYGPAPGTTHVLASGVLGLAKMEGDLMVYLREEQGKFYLHTATPEKEAACYRLGDAGGQGKVLFAGGGLWRRQFGACAVLAEAGDQEKWCLFTASKTNRDVPESRLVCLPAGWKAVGLIHDGQLAVFALLVMSANRQTLGVFDGERVEPLFTCANAMAKVTVCPASGLVAMLGEAREVLVYSTRERRLCLHLHGKHGMKQGGADA